MKRKMIDPPEGWRYGFPKEMPEHVDNTRQWLIENGYPEKEIEALGDSFYVRGWYEEVEREIPPALNEALRTYDGKRE
jgi:hypothetical protein